MKSFHILQDTSKMRENTYNNADVSLTDTFNLSQVSQATEISKETHDGFEACA